MRKITVIGSFLIGLIRGMKITSFQLRKKIKLWANPVKAGDAKPRV